MKKTQIRKFLAYLNAQNIKESDDWISCSCPLARWTHDSGKDGNPSFAIKVGARSAFNCFTCHTGSLYELVRLLDRYDPEGQFFDIPGALAVLEEEHLGGIDFDIPEYGATQARRFVPWPEIVVNQFPSVFDVPRALEYLTTGRKTKRGFAFKVPHPIIKNLDLRYDKRLDAVVFPIRHFSGGLAGLRGRRLSGQIRYHDYSTKETRNAMVWYGEHWLDRSKPVVMVESVFDLASVLRVYPNVIAPLSVGMSKAKIDQMKDLQRVITFFDHGAGGDKARRSIRRDLNCPVEHVYPLLGVSDPADMTDFEIYKTLQPVLPDMV